MARRGCASYVLFAVVASFSVVAAAGRVSLHPVGPNLDLVRRLEAAGLLHVVERSPRPAADDPWQSPSLKGVAYLPSPARNQIAQWRDYNDAINARELGFAAAAGATAVRVSLHWALFATDAAGLQRNLDSFVATAAALKLRVFLTAFDGLGDDPGGDAVGLVTSGAYRTRDYLQNPGFGQLANATLRPMLAAYVAWLASRYGSDARIVGVDAYFRPNLCASDPECPTYAFLDWTLSALSAGFSSGFVTTTVIPGAEACDAKNVPTANRSLVAFENYNGNRGAVGGDTQGVQSCASSLGGLPTLLTGSMGRLEAPPSSLCEILFECFGKPFLDIPPHPQIGYFLPWLIISSNNTFTRDVPVPNQGLIFPNGTWFDQQERVCFSAAVPPFPPPPPGPPPPGVNFTTPDGLTVGLRNTTRAVQVLGLENDTRYFGNFSFVPPLWNYIPEKPHRDFPGCHHIGDATFRVQPASETNASLWAFYSTASAGDDAPAEPLAHSNADVYDLANMTAAAAHSPLDGRFPLGLQVLRSVEKAPGGRPGFAIRWNISVASFGAAVRVGGLGFSLISDTFFGGTNNTAIIAFGSFLDAHVGGAHGFATLTRADGSAALLVTTCGGDDPAVAQASGMEAWRPILEDASPPGEGIYEWSVHTAAWASEWNRNAQAPELTFPDDDAHRKAWPEPLSPWPSWHLHETVHLPNPRPWNTPTSVTLQPGGPVASYALCFSLPPPDAAVGVGPRVRDAGLAAAGRAMLTGVPGFVVSSDMAGSAFLFVLPGSGTALTRVATDDPALLAVDAAAPAPGADGYVRIPVAGVVGARGRARLVLSFSDGTTTSVHYYVLPPLRDLGVLYGSFAASTSWLPRDFLDPFGRSASFMPWDREDKVHVLQDGRPFVVGLSDDAGAGANLGMASKLAAAPHAGQLMLLDQYVSATLLGTKPDTASPPLFSLQDPETWRIFMTVWYFDKSPLNATDYYKETDKCTIGPSWCAFNSPWCNPQWCALPPGGSGGWSPATYRQYNFPHQTAVYLALYLAARNYDLLPGRAQAWSFYLNAAVKTAFAANCPRADGGYDCLVTVGLMDGTVWRSVLLALESEGADFAAQAAELRGLMRNRTLGDGKGVEGWNTQDNPAGSEFAWDTTGQEEVAVWGAFFNASYAGWMHGDLNGRTVDSILGYMSSLPTWAFHGAAYGMGDFSNNAKWMVTEGWEREGGHYRSGLNSIPVIERYRAHPSDFYLLQVGIGGVMAPLPNIDADGAPSMAFHTHPFIMEHDPNSGDHGLGFFGSSLNAGAYFHVHSTLGPLCFMCVLSNDAGATIIAPRDMYRKRAYLSPLGLWLVAEAGSLQSVALSADAAIVTVTFESSASAAAEAGLEGSAAPYSLLRLRVEQAAPTERAFSFVLTAPAGAQVVRGAYAFAPAADDGAVTTATIEVV